MSYHSKHTFMFPFQWDYIKDSKKMLSYNERTKLKDFERLFESLDNGLKKVKYEIGNDTEKYNEYTYFHSFVRKAMFYTEDKDFLRYYEIDVPNGEYNIEYYGNSKSDLKTLKLSLDSICLHIYDIGVGIISFNLTNHKYQDQESILAINEFGRRLYPQFMTENDRLSAKTAFLPNRIYGSIGNITFNEDYTAYQNPIAINNTFLPPDHIKKVFGYMGQEQLGDMGKKFVFTKQYEKNDTIRIRQVTDDRMFFLSWYGNNEKAQKLNGIVNISNDDDKKNKIKELINPTFEYEINDFWYTYIFGDKKFPSIQNLKMQKDHLIQHTYTRWLKYSTFFGITRDSFVCLSSTKESLIKLNAPPLDIHMQSIYYQMAILCLIQRASILRFSWEVSQITNKIFSDKKANPDNAIKDLYENYIRFINQIYFREVSPQIQGIELYTMFQEAMNLDKNVKDLDGEMREIFSYLSVKEQTSLGKVANLFLPIALITGFFGMNSINDNFFDYKLSEIGINLANITLYDIVTIILFIWILIIFTIQIYNTKIKSK